ncbi:GTP 3',8-cyclase MoaA [Mangrovibacterium marinum]|uniref:Cyclic pyranopterin phosphate synthase n=1 Tax=Mangrovibacterium marinum TaxID=1639118 RepID=A0A2T5C509_9BACT|nr:radical SAM protein [Mangrovibacterium marinum]PTN09933.1 cyclic pyranopterin phosphate synthase [Mangrovibacterium marinum]
MLDRFNRHINYLRISVTDRCNLRCTYCMPADGIQLMRHEDILSFEEIEAFARLAIAKGITKIRLTGGEPLIRKNISELVRRLAAIEGLEDLALTTNGLLLPQFATELKDAGLQRVNISLDTINADRYRQITRTGDLNAVLAGIKAAQQAGFDPIKINCVLLGEPDDEVKRLKDFCSDNDLQLRFIHQMDLQNGEFSKVEGGEGGNCSRCNRVRLLANGDVKPCLFSDLAYNIGQLGHQQALDLAIGNKPRSGTFNKSGEFYNIGG